jgi:phosphatidylserine/phosphatidylglycerophosphate/cardiolipin synthase-like enzyme
VGSSNLDQRSLQINYELMIRFHSPEIAKQARQVFADNLVQCQKIELAQWNATRSLWQRLKQRLAYLVLVRIDPYFAQREWRSVPD